MSEAGSTLIVRSSGTWLEGLSQRQKLLAGLCAQKSDDAEILEALALVMGCYDSLEKPWCFLAVEALLPPSTFWRAFHQYWPSFEQPPHGRYLWSLKRRRRHWRVNYMGHDDAAAFDALPETLRIYRDKDDSTRIALSWRLGEGARHGSCKDVDFIEAKTPKAAVAGLYRSNSEAEIVLFSCRDAAALS